MSHGAGPCWWRSVATPKKTKKKGNERKREKKETAATDREDERLAEDIHGPGPSAARPFAICARLVHLAPAGRPPALSRARRLIGMAAGGAMAQRWESERGTCKGMMSASGRSLC